MVIRHSNVKCDDFFYEKICPQYRKASNCFLVQFLVILPPKSMIAKKWYSFLDLDKIIAKNDIVISYFHMKFKDFL